MNCSTGFVVLLGPIRGLYGFGTQLMLENLNKSRDLYRFPSFPFGMVRTDGRENFINPSRSCSQRAGNSRWFRKLPFVLKTSCTGVTGPPKFNARTFRRFCFRKLPGSCRGRGLHPVLRDSDSSNPISRSFKVHKELDENIAILKLFPGINQKFTKHAYHAGTESRDPGDLRGGQCANGGMVS